MQRVIVAQADLSATALAELKDWLAITTSREDDTLTRLLHASLATCEAFIRQIPLDTIYEETHAVSSGWQTLGLVPVRSITQVEAIAADATRSPIPSDQYLIDITSEGCGRFRLLAANPAAKLAVRYTAGLAPDWESLPDGVRHGVMRLAAYHFSARDNNSGDVMPPAAVSALWHPWRRMRLA